MGIPRRLPRTPLDISPLQNTKGFDIGLQDLVHVLVIPVYKGRQPDKLPDLLVMYLRSLADRLLDGQVISLLHDHYQVENGPIVHLFSFFSKTEQVVAETNS